MLAIAESGERKTTCDNLALASVKAHQDALAASYTDEMKHFENAKAIAAGERRRIENNKEFSADEKLEELDKIPEPQQPLAPVVRVKEPTIEGLFNLLQTGQPSMGLFTSEGGQFLGGHGMKEDAAYGQ